jgi:hypothetical protein
MGEASKNVQEPRLYAAALNDNNTETASLIKRLEQLEEYDQVDEVIIDVERKKKERNLGSLSEGFSPMYIAQSRTIVLPKQLMEGYEDGRELFAVLSKRLKLTVRTYSDESFKIGDLPKTDLEFLRGVIHGVWGDEPIALHAKKSDFEEGRTLVRAAQIVGDFALNGHLDLLWKNHKLFSNNPGEVSMSNKTPVIPLKERLKRCFLSHEKALADLAYTLLKKTSHTVPDEELSKHILHCTMSYGAYVNLHFKQKRAVQNTKRKKQSNEISKIPQKPSSSSILKKSELKIILDIHNSVFREPSFARKHDEWVYAIWNGDKDAILDTIKHDMGARTLFLQKLGSLTTRRLNRIRKFLNSPSKRKADITPAELVSYLESRKAPLDEYLMEVISLQTPNTESWLKQCLGVESGYELSTISIEQKSVLKANLLELLQEDEFYTKASQPPVKEDEQAVKKTKTKTPKRAEAKVEEGSDSDASQVTEPVKTSKRATVPMVSLSKKRTPRHLA